MTRACRRRSAVPLDQVFNVLVSKTLNQLCYSSLMSSPRKENRGV